MQITRRFNSGLTSLVLASACLFSGEGLAADPYRGLWVGEVTLRYVNEVSIPLDEDNVPIAPQPTVPTPTKDAANLRLILHVNGAGQVTLLKEVALLARKADLLRSANDLALVTDERLYGDFPPQPAQRIATVAFDYGDAQATAAVTAVIDAAVDAVYDSVKNLGLADLDTAAEREAAVTAAVNAANAASATPAIIPTADAAVAFNRFLTMEFNSGVVDQVAEDLAPGVDPVTVVGDPLNPSPNSLRGKAKDLAGDSFYEDTRALDLIDAIVAGVDGEADLERRQAIAQAITSSYADLLNDYQRFIAGESFGDMITAASEGVADAAAEELPAAIEEFAGEVGGSSTEVVSIDHQLETGDEVWISGASEEAFNGRHVVGEVLSEDRFSIAVPFAGEPANAPAGSWVNYGSVEGGLAGVTEVSDAEAEALRIEVPQYDDNRASEAIKIVLTAVTEAAAQAAADLPAADPDARAPSIALAAEEAGRQALETDVPRYPMPAGAPSPDYTEFVRSEIYQQSAGDAAQAAAEEAVFEVANNILATERSIRGKARAAANQALESVFSAAARVAQSTLPVSGDLGPGATDAKLTVELGPDEELGAPDLEAVIVLAASHPTNPFRHRRHPDHTVGLEVERRISLDFDSDDRSPHPRAGYGVDRLTGVYREEIQGLHKPLGPEPEDNPIGLRVEGTFELQRLSSIDTLNAR